MNHQIPNALLKLAEIAGPIVVGRYVGFEPANNLLGQLLLYIRHHTLNDEPNKIYEDCWVVLNLRMQAWCLNHIGAESIVKVFAKMAFVDLRLQIPVGRSDELALKFASLALSGSLKLPILQYP